MKIVRASNGLVLVRHWFRWYVQQPTCEHGRTAMKPLTELEDIVASFNRAGYSAATPQAVETLIKGEDRNVHS